MSRGVMASGLGELAARPRSEILDEEASSHWRGGLLDAAEDCECDALPVESGELDCFGAGKVGKTGSGEATAAFGAIR